MQCTRTSELDAATPASSKSISLDLNIHLAVCKTSFFHSLKWKKYFEYYSTVKIKVERKNVFKYYDTGKTALFTLPLKTYD